VVDRNSRDKNILPVSYIRTSGGWVLPLLILATLSLSLSIKYWSLDSSI